MRLFFPSLIMVFVLGLGSAILAQNESDATQPADSAAPVAAEKTSDSKLRVPTADEVKETGKKIKAQAEDEVSKIAKTIDQDPRAKSVSAGILEPIYQVAEALAFPAFHWLAFALMSAGVFSYALQLVLGKLVVLTRMGFSLERNHIRCRRSGDQRVRTCSDNPGRRREFDIHTKSGRSPFGHGRRSAGGSHSLPLGPVARTQRAAAGRSRPAVPPKR